MHWLAFQNYLTAPEFKDALEDQIEKIRTEKTGLMDQFPDLSKLVYAIQDDSGACFSGFWANLFLKRKPMKRIIFAMRTPNDCFW